MTVRRLWLAAAAAVALPATVAASGGPGIPEPAGWQPRIVLAAQNGVGHPPASARWVVTPSAAEMAAAVSRLEAQQSVRQALAPGVGSEQGLQVLTILVKRAISAAFPEIQQIGGVRADSLKWHPTGLAIDVMIPGYGTPEGTELGDRVASFVLTNADRFGLDHVIWQQVYYPANGNPQVMPNLGSDNANHYTHVHIATRGGGYPTGTESYFS